MSTEPSCLRVYPNSTRSRSSLFVKCIWLKTESTMIGHRALTPQFIHRLITRARGERLVYLAVHNHGSDRQVGFSDIDLRSHERGYPALLQIAKGMPVGALVLGRRAMQAVSGCQTAAVANSTRRASLV